MKEKMKSLYWLLGKNSHLDLIVQEAAVSNRRQTDLTYGCLLWACASQTSKQSKGAKMSPYTF